MVPLQTPTRPYPATLGQSPTTRVDKSPPRGDRPATRAARPRKGPDPQLWQDEQWRNSGSCRDENPSLFFAPDHESPHQRRLRETAAKAICARCPVRTACRAYALRTGELYGIWGGTTERERSRSHARASRAASIAVSA
jgi:WhiB family redox-sensing transcriptional regulator